MKEDKSSPTNNLFFLTWKKIDEMITGLQNQNKLDQIITGLQNQNTFVAKFKG